MTEIKMLIPGQPFISTDVEHVPRVGDRVALGGVAYRVTDVRWNFTETLRDRGYASPVRKGVARIPVVRLEEIQEVEGMKAASQSTDQVVNQEAADASGPIGTPTNLEWDHDEVLGLPVARGSLHGVPMGSITYSGWGQGRPWEANTTLPGTRFVGHFATSPEAKEALEGHVASWFARMLS